MSGLSLVLMSTANDNGLAKVLPSHHNSLRARLARRVLPSLLS